MRQIISSEYLLPNLGSRLQFTKMFRPLCEYPSLRHLLFDRSRYRDRFSMALMSYWLFLSRRYRMFMANFFRFISSQSKRSLGLVFLRQKVVYWDFSGGGGCSGFSRRMSQRLTVLYVCVSVCGGVCFSSGWRRKMKASSLLALVFLGRAGRLLLSLTNFLVLLRSGKECSSILITDLVVRLHPSPFLPQKSLALRAYLLFSEWRWWKMKLQLRVLPWWVIPSSPPTSQSFRQCVCSLIICRLLIADDSILPIIIVHTRITSQYSPPLCTSLSRNMKWPTHDGRVVL